MNKSEIKAVKQEAEKIMSGVALLPVEEVDIEFLKPYENNSKVHDKAHIERLRANIEREGLQESLLLEGSGVIVAGHGRFEAIKLLGWKTVPVRIMRGYTEAQCMIHRVSSNLTVSTKYDSVKQAEELSILRDLMSDDVSLDELAAMTGFSERDIEVLSEDISALSDLDDLDLDITVESETSAPAEPSNEAPQVEVKTVTLAKLFGFNDLTPEQARDVRKFAALAGIEDAETLHVYAKEFVNTMENM